MIEKLLYGIAMLIITLAIQFFLFRKGKSTSFWSGKDLVLILCVLGLISNDSSYLAGILGYVLGDYIGEFAGWHKFNQK